MGLMYKILQRVSDGLFSASHFCELFNKQWYSFARQPSTKKYITLLKRQGIEGPIKVRRGLGQRSITLIGLELLVKLSDWLCLGLSATLIRSTTQTTVSQQVKLTKVTKLLEEEYKKKNDILITAQANSSSSFLSSSFQPSQSSDNTSLMVLNDVEQQQQLVQFKKHYEDQLVLLTEKDQQVMQYKK